MFCLFRIQASFIDNPAVVHGASFVYIPTHQARTSLRNALDYPRHSKEDCVVLVSTPTKSTFSPQPWRGKYYTMLPINGDPDADRSPLRTFAAANLLRTVIKSPFTLQKNGP